MSAEDRHFREALEEAEMQLYLALSQLEGRSVIRSFACQRLIRHSAMLVGKIVEQERRDRRTA